MEGLQIKNSDSMFNPELELVADLLKRFPLNKMCNTDTKGMG